MNSSTIGSRPFYPAFTLSELLIVLVILGLIATFAIPKVLQAVEVNQNKAVFKEATAIVFKLVQQDIAKKPFGGYIIGKRWYHSTANLVYFNNLFSQGINILQQCTTSSDSTNATNSQLVAYGTINPPDKPTAIGHGWMGAVTLHNGGSLAYTTACSTQARLTSCVENTAALYISIDANGSQAPNQVGVDKLTLRVDADGGLSAAYLAIAAERAANAALYQQVFQ